jgi:hypothetical protein
MSQRNSTFVLYFVIVVISLLAIRCSKNDNPVAPTKTREDLWKEDITFLQEELPKRQLNPFFKLSQVEWNRQLDSLKTILASRNDQEIFFSMAKIVASIGVAHTSIMPTKYDNYRCYPLAFQWFSDGLFVVGCSPTYQSVLGKKLTVIGTKNINEVYNLIAPFISHENDQWLKAASPYYINIANLLKFVSAADSTTTGQFTFEGAGVVVISSLSVTSLPLMSQPNYISVARNLGSNIPLYLQHTTTNYWYTTVDSEKVIYFQYNKCADMSNQSFNAFAPGLLSFIDAHPNSKVVVDLRLNTGGNSSILQPFIDGIKIRTVGNTTGKLFILIGCNTFSSGLLNAITLKTETQAILVGEPTGGKPNSYGEVKNFTLPYSSVMVQYSTKFFNTMPGDPLSLNPDVTRQISFADYAAGKDPVLDYVRSY